MTTPQPGGSPPDLGLGRDREAVDKHLLPPVLTSGAVAAVHEEMTETLVQVYGRSRDLPALQKLLRKPTQSGNEAARLAQQFIALRRAIRDRDVETLVAIVAQPPALVDGWIEVLAEDERRIDLIRRRAIDALKRAKTGVTGLVEAFERLPKRDPPRWTSEQGSRRAWIVFALVRLRSPAATRALREWSRRANSGEDLGTPAKDLEVALRLATSRSR
jgi:hypothetical protein